MNHHLLDEQLDMLSYLLGNRLDKLVLSPPFGG